MPEVEFWQLTPRALCALMDRARAGRQREDFHFALLTAVTFNGSLRVKKAKRIEDFLLSPIDRKPSRPVSSSVLKQKAIMLFTAAGFPPKGLDAAR